MNDWPTKISSIFDHYFPTVSPPLNHTTPFTLLIAVLLSAQCTDERVNRITPLLFSKADSPRQMSSLSYTEILNIIKPCGLGPKKSKAIKDLSTILVETFNSVVPKTLSELMSLPGVGRKTASVILLQAFNIPAFPVDTHIIRLANRFKLSSSKNPLKIEEDLKQIFPDPTQWGKLHLQFIFFGRKFCPARQHLPENCPICHLMKATHHR